MKVLIVEGSKQNRYELVSLLGELTNVVVQGAVSHVRSALHAIADASPDVVVTGTTLPDGDGTHLIERVRKLATAPSIVVVGPAATTADQKQRYFEAGADRFVEGDLQQVQAAVAGLRIRATGSIPPYESQRLLGRMTAGVVHDLNNYMGVLTASLQMMERSADRALWPQIRATVESINDLVATLLHYARGANPPTRALDLGNVVRHALLVGKQLVPSEINLIVDIGPVRPILGVAAEIEQLVLNLVSNAVDAMPRGGELRVSVHEATQHAILLEVCDTGCGGAGAPISGRTLSTKPMRYGGAGLGLGIVHGVVDRHQGSVRIVDLANGGTMAAVMFPTLMV